MRVRSETDLSRSEELDEFKEKSNFLFSVLVLARVLVFIALPKKFFN